MNKTLILFESKGFPVDISEKLALILGPAKAFTIDEFVSTRLRMNFKEDDKDYNTVVICIPVCSDAIPLTVLDFAAANSTWLKRKKVFLLGTYADAERMVYDLEPLTKILSGNALLSAFIHEDNNQLVETAMKIKELKDKPENAADEKELIGFMNDFIGSHNTCTLATSHGENVRATPIEYIYQDNVFYILSEGGEKFAGILVNPNVSLCIYDDFHGMKSLAGIQITGTAELIQIGSDEYYSVLMKKGIHPDRLPALPAVLNLIKISMSKAEFLWSEFVSKGYDIKQIIYFKE